MHIYTSTAITCPGLPAWEGMLLNTTETTSGTAVNATCSKGYSFPDEGHEVKVTKCNATGQWNPGINDCVGKFIVVIKWETFARGV